MRARFAGRCPGRAHAQAGRPPAPARWNALPALGPVVGDLLAAHARRARRRLCLARGQRRQLSGRAVERVLHEAARRRPARSPAGASSSSAASTLLGRRRAARGWRGGSAQRPLHLREQRLVGRLAQVVRRRATRAAPRAARFWRALRLRGITTFSTTCWSPRPAAPDRSASPCRAASRPCRAGCPAATSISSSPSSVGTVTFVPSAAAGAGTSTTVTRSLPSRRKRSSSATRTSTYRSPGGPPRSPAWPRPVSRMRCSSAIPAGMSTSSVLRTAAARARRTPSTARRGSGRRRRSVARVLAHQLAERGPRDRAQLARRRRRSGRSRSACPARRRCRGSARRCPPGRTRPPRTCRARPRASETSTSTADVAALDPAAAAAAERRAERVAAEERVEDVGERAEAVRLRRVAARVEPLEAVAVVGRAALGVGEDLVRLGGLLELLLGLRVVAVHVRVQLAREPPEGLLDLGLVGVAGDAEHLVRVAPHSS